MCDKRASVNLKINGKQVRVDACLRGFIKHLNEIGFKTVACCCGHGKYPHSILILHPDGHVYDCYSKMTWLTVQRRYYERDGQGLYHIPLMSGYVQGHNLLKELKA